jgi:hypothetical protein
MEPRAAREGGLVASPGEERSRFGALVARLVPGGVLEAVEPIRPDAGSGATAKAEGYAEPVRLRVCGPDGRRSFLVFRTMAANPFGHDRRADRFDGLVLAYDAFGQVPDHVAALEVGAIAADGSLLSLARCGEPYLVTGWAEGRPYADDLRRIAERGAGSLDLARCDALVDWLVRLHREPVEDPVAWRRALRDLLGHGEGIFGVVDGYRDGVPGAPPERLEALERSALAWRWRLRPQAGRLRRIHGDFHPFNIVFGEGLQFALLDASRGGLGDPADDLAALTINFPFFALDRPGAWRGLGPLWHRAWSRYLEARGEDAVLESTAPFLAWRALVLGCPRFYPGLSAGARSALLGLAERALAAPAFDPAWVEALFP